MYLPPEVNCSAGAELLDTTVVVLGPELDETTVGGPEPPEVTVIVSVTVTVAEQPPPPPPPPPPEEPVLVKIWLVLPVVHWYVWRPFPSSRH